MDDMSKFDMANENLLKVRERLVAEEIKMGKVYALAYKKPLLFYLEHSVEEATEIIKAEAGVIRMEYENMYALLDRYKQDCKYFLSHGHRNIKNLHGKSVEKHIERMYELYEAVPVKPEWLTLDDIRRYEKCMKEEMDKHAQFWEILFWDAVGACMQADKKPTKKKVAEELEDYMTAMGYTKKDIFSIEAISAEDAARYYAVTY